MTLATNQYQPLAFLLAIALLGVLNIGCTRENTRKDRPPQQATARALEAKAPQQISIWIQLPESLNRVTGIQSYLERQFDLVSQMLLRSSDLLIVPRRQDPPANQLTLKLYDPRSEHITEVATYGQFSIQLPLALEEVASGRHGHFSNALYRAILGQLGLPAPCSSGELRRLSPFSMKVIGHHLRKKNDRLDFASTSLPEVSQRILVDLEAAGRTPACFNTLLGKERIKLWEDMSALASFQSQSPQTFVSEGTHALEKGDFKKAYHLCKANAEQRPQTGAARCAAEASQRLGLYQEASRFWRAHLAFFPKDRMGLIALARAVGRQGDDDGARALLEMGTKRFPNWVDAKIELGIALYRLGNSQAAKRQWAQALELQPDNLDALNLLRQY